MEKQKLIILVGLPCSGKTTLSKKLEVEFNANTCMWMKLDKS